MNWASSYVLPNNPLQPTAGAPGAGCFHPGHAPAAAERER
jgi:hypothetical protein